MLKLQKLIYDVENLTRCLENNENIVIYGVGDYGKRVIDYIYRVNFEKKIKAIIVTEKYENEKEYRNIEILGVSAFFQDVKSVIF